MSQQHDDDGTVIRPEALASAVSPGVASLGQTGKGQFDGAEDGLSLRIGTRVSEFEITQRIGEGGFSIVYLAMDHSLERTVALKEYMPSSLATRVGSTQVQPRSQRYRDTFEAGLKSFVNEAKLLAQFDHPALVKVYRFWEANGTAYMVMPFYQGITVKDAIRAMPEPPDEAWLLALLAPLTEALLVIHAERCYHRDIAPDNVILLASSAKPLLLDFGAARRVIGDMTQALTVILKAGYAPVEQYAEVPGMKQGPWTDVYALGAVVYWAITGKTPPASVGRMLSDSFVPLAECATGRYSMRFLQAIDRALIVLPDHRTQTIEALRQDLGLTVEGTDSRPPPMQWNDSDATVIRPSAYKPGPPTITRRASPDVALGPIQTGQPMLAAPGPTRGAGLQHGNAGLERQALLDDAAARPVSADGAETRTRPRRMVLVVSVVGAAVTAAGIWWTFQRPTAESSRPVRGDASAIAPDPQPTVTQGVAAAPGVAVPVAAEQSASPSATELTTKMPPAVVTETAPTIPAVPIPPIELAPEMPPIRAAKKVTGPAQPEQDSKRASQRPGSATPERVQADSTNHAECGRIFQRLSLGESNPELMDRLKLLKCR